MDEETQESKAEHVPLQEVEAPPVVQHSWSSLVLGSAAVFVLASVTVALAVLFVRSRPLDLARASLETTEALDELLRVSQVPLGNILTTEPQFHKTSRAHFYYVDYTVTLPESVSLDGLTKLIERSLFPRGVLVTLEPSEAYARTMGLMIGEHRVATVTLRSAALPRPAPQVAAQIPAGVEPAREKSARGSFWRRPVVEASTETQETAPQTAPEPPVSGKAPSNLTANALAGAWRPPTTDSLAVREARESIVQVPRTIGGGRPMVAIIVDDGGYGGPATDVILSLTARLTLSILPNTPLGSELADEAALHGFEIMLHMPMENTTGELAHEGQIETIMDAADMERLVADALRQVPGAVGINNHMGSKFTEDDRALGTFMGVIEDLGLFFIDSRTTSKSHAHDMAMAFNIPSARRDLFLDHENDVETIRRRFRELMERAQREGTAIGICHFRINTASVLREMLPELRVAGIELVHASRLVQ